MVSPLWKACSEGDVQKVHEMLHEPSAVDIELKDHTGVTPLIEAVRTGHVEIVRLLLDKGADPANASMQGRPETYTSEPAILELLHAAQNKAIPNGFPSHQPVYNHDGHDDAEKQFYAPLPPDPYTYYPTINPALSTVNEGGAYYPPPQPQHPVDGAPDGVGHLPPPEVARMIPCRYFPACRYGAQCMFAHPQQAPSPYYQGPMPPVQFPPYDHMGNPYIPHYYPSPPSFQQPPSAHPMTPMSPPPGPPMMHARNHSEALSPAAAHFSPNGAPPPLPYGPMSPPVYGHPGQGHIPIPIPQHHSQPPHPHPGPPSPPNVYNSTSPVPPPFPLPLHQDGSFVPQGQPPNVVYPNAEANGKIPPENALAENYTNHPNHHNGGGHYRRGSGRRLSFGAKRPPCLFFPAGRCKNGDDCRFPHILPDGTVVNQAAMLLPFSRNSAPRPSRGPAHVNGPNGIQNGVEAKLNNMSIRDDQPRQRNGVESSSRSHSSDASNRPKFPPGSKQNHHHHAGSNGHNLKKVPLKMQQRVPSADDFPVLSTGATTPPKWGNGANGLTAAQVLQAPPPARKDASKESSTRGTSPDPARGNPLKEATTEVNGVVNEKTAPVPAPEQAVHHNSNKHSVMSFAAVATNGTSEVSKEVSVSA